MKKTATLAWGGALLLCLAVALAAWFGWRASRPWAQPAQAPRTPVPDGVLMTESVPYCAPSPPSSLLLDYAEPRDRAAPRPAVVLVHGGAWMHGNRWELRSLMLRLAQEGYVAASIDYRLAPGARFPAQLEDVKCAVRWLRSQAGPLAVDAGRIAAWGHSAGGHLVALLATTQGQAAFEGQGGHAGFDSQVQAAVAHGGLHDLAAVHDQPPTMIPDALRGVESLLGSTEPGALRMASPVAHAHAGAAPLLIIHGESDRVVSAVQAQRLHDALQARQARSQLMLLPGAGHADLGIDTAGAMAQAMAFLRQQLQPAATPRSAASEPTSPAATPQASRPTGP